MSAVQVRVVGVALALLLILVSGILVSRKGKPYNTALFTVHKLVGLAAGVLLAVTVYQAHQAAPLGVVEVSAVVATVLLFAATVAAGGLLSVDKEAPAAALKLHQVLPIFAVLSTAGTLYLLLSA